MIIYIDILYTIMYMDMNGDQWLLTHCIGLHGIHQVFFQSGD